MTHGSVAAKVRAAKERNPMRYCSDMRCLWNLLHGPCPKHMGGGQRKDSQRSDTGETAAEPPSCDDPGAHRPGCECNGGEPKL